MVAHTHLQLPACVLRTRTAGSHEVSVSPSYHDVDRGQSPPESLWSRGPMSMPSQLGALRWQRPSGRSIYLLLHTGRLDLFHDQRTRVRGSFPSRRWCGRVWRRMEMCRHRPIYNLTIERTAVKIGEKERSTNKRTLSMRGKERIRVLSPATKWPQRNTCVSIALVWSLDFW